MNYLEFINDIIESRGQWNIQIGEYFEKHHILPVCLGGTGDFKNNKFKKHSHNINCIWLTAKEHFIAHKLLAEENPNNYKLVLAWSMMAFPKGSTKRDFELTPEEYEELRLLQSNVSKDKKLSEEAKNKIRNKNAGRKQTDEEKLKKSISMKEKNIRWFTNGIEEIRCTVETCPEGFVPGRSEDIKNIAKQNLGKPRFGKDNGMFGKQLSDERKKQNADWASARKWFNNGQIEVFEINCPNGFLPGRLKPKKIIWPKWLLPDGSIREMKPCLVRRYHPDWILIEEK